MTTIIPVQTLQTTNKAEDGLAAAALRGIANFAV